MSYQIFAAYATENKRKINSNDDYGDCGEFRTLEEALAECAENISVDRSCNGIDNDECYTSNYVIRNNETGELYNSNGEREDYFPHFSFMAGYYNTMSARGNRWTHKVTIRPHEVEDALERGDSLWFYDGKALKDIGMGDADHVVTEWEEGGHIAWESATPEEMAEDWLNIKDVTAVDGDAFVEEPWIWELGENYGWDRTLYRSDIINGDKGDKAEAYSPERIPFEQAVVAVIEYERIYNGKKNWAVYRQPQ